MFDTAATRKKYAAKLKAAAESKCFRDPTQLDAPPKAICCGMTFRIVDREVPAMEVVDANGRSMIVTSSVRGKAWNAQGRRLSEVFVLNCWHVWGHLGGLVI